MTANGDPFLQLVMLSVLDLCNCIITLDQPNYEILHFDNWTVCCKLLILGLRMKSDKAAFYLLFYSLFISMIFFEWLRETKIGCKKCVLDCADDLNLMVPSQEGMQSLIYICEDYVMSMVYYLIGQKFNL